MTQAGVLVYSEFGNLTGGRWSQEGVAHESGLNPSHVAKIERTEREPGVRSISKLRKGLGISAAELFDGIDGR
jgi:transcriptional regulator with XRE-family HTH domain